MVPLAFAVASLTARYPKAGGLYLWTRNDFGPGHGFVCFWVYWMGLAVWFPSAAMFYMSAALHAMGLPLDPARTFWPPRCWRSRSRSAPTWSA